MDMNLETSCMESGIMMEWYQSFESWIQHSVWSVDYKRNVSWKAQSLS